MVIIVNSKNKWYLIIFFLVLLININVRADDCNGLFSADLIGEIKQIFQIIQFAVPIILILLTSFDFAKAVFVQNKDGLDKAKNNFMKRVVAALIVFFAPYIVIWVMKLVSLDPSCVSQF